MTRFLLVAVAHGLDLVTFLVVVAALPIHGEANPLARAAYMGGGVGVVIALKTAGTLALACITYMRAWALIPAAGAGLIGASVNLLAIPH